MAIKNFAVALPTEPLIFQPGELTVRDRIVSSDWRQMLPVLHGAGFHLREQRRSDAASLFSILTTRRSRGRRRVLDRRVGLRAGVGGPFLLRNLYPALTSLTSAAGAIAV
jgi:hypothetical protein